MAEMEVVLGRMVMILPAFIQHSSPTSKHDLLKGQAEIDHADDPSSHQGICVPFHSPVA